jgi:signal transduction histidine kinase
VIAAPALLVIAMVVIASLVFLAQDSGNSDAAARAGLARVGEALALVIVANGVVAPSSFVTIWGVVAPLLALLPTLVIGWALAGRVRRIVDDSERSIEAADEQRRRQVEEVVHELRTPLAVMGTNLELAADEVEAGTAPSGYIEASRRAVERMARTVDDLAGHGALAVEEEAGPVDLAALAQMVVSEHVGPSRAHGIHVVTTGKSGTMVPAADPAAVGTAVGNFLANAVRLAPRGSRISVDWGEVGGWAWIAVTDEGPGLAPHFHARAFERGWQGPHDRDRVGSNGEAGLGLTIARQLTEAQGGAVTLESEEGGGATFTVWLPLHHGADPDSVVAADRVHPVIRPWRKDLQPA